MLLFMADAPIASSYASACWSIKIVPVWSA